MTTIAHLDKLIGSLDQLVDAGVGLPPSMVRDVRDLLVLIRDDADQPPVLSLVPDEFSVKV